MQRTNDPAHVESRVGDLIILRLGKYPSSVECICDFGACFEFVLLGCGKKTRWQLANKKMMLQFVYSHVSARAGLCSRFARLC